MNDYGVRGVMLDSGLTALALRGLKQKEGHYPFIERFTKSAAPPVRPGVERPSPGCRDLSFRFSRSCRAGSRPRADFGLTAPARQGEASLASQSAGRKNPDGVLCPAYRLTRTGGTASAWHQRHRPFYAPRATCRPPTARS